MGAWADFRRRTRIVWRLGLAFTGILGGLWLGDQLVPRRTLTLDAETPAVSRLAETPGSSQTVLLLGLDQATINRPPKGQLQLMLLARVHPQGGIELLQIPPELKVMLPGRQLKSLQQLYGIGGVALTSDVVARLLGGSGEPQPPDRYLLMPLDGLRQAIDGLGGVPLLLREAIRYTDTSGGLQIDLQPGQQWLNGEQTSQLLRYRGPGSEAARRQRLELLLSPLAQRLADPSVVPSLPPLLLKLGPSMETNLSQGELLSLLAAALQEPQRMRLSRLPLQQNGPHARLEPSMASLVLQNWQQANPPAASDTLVMVSGSDAISTGTALARLLQAGQPAQEALQPLESPIPTTLIRYSGNRDEALAVRRALGLGELEMGPTSPGAGVHVLIGNDWS